MMHKHSLLKFAQSILRADCSRGLMVKDLPVQESNGNQINVHLPRKSGYGYVMSRNRNEKKEENAIKGP